MPNYKVVPNMISCKDLDYLTDMFEWNYMAYKNTYNSIEKVSNDEIQDILREGLELFEANMEQILKILEDNYE